LRIMTTRSIRKYAGGFTLIEILVVIGIIVVIAGITLPMILRSWRSASRTRIAADLNTIATALEEYRKDFGDYPRIPTDPVTGRTIEGTGFAVLCKALYSPGPADMVGSWPACTVPYNAGTVALQGVLPNAVQYLALKETSTPAPSTDWVKYG